jgi:hypothetical protein
MKRTSIEIAGNRPDPNGNAVAYERMTQRSKWKDPAARRYLPGKNSFKITGSCRPASLCLRKRTATTRLDVICYFKGERHADPENVRKGIQDAIFQVSGSPCSRDGSDVPCHRESETKNLSLGRATTSGITSPEEVSKNDSFDPSKSMASGCVKT